MYIIIEGKNKFKLDRTLDGRQDKKGYQVLVFNNLSEKRGTLTPIENWFEMIRQSEHSALIEHLRNFPQGHQKEYKDAVVKHILPVALYNFHSGGKKEKSSLKTSTGLIFTEVDDPRFEISSIDVDKVFAYYRSLRGQGWHIIAKVKNVTVDNFQDAWNAVNVWLGIAKPDQGVCKPSQPAFLSYDRELFHNPESIVFEFNVSTNRIINTINNTTLNNTLSVSTHNLSTHNNSTYCPMLSYNNTPNTYETVGHPPIRFDNLKDLVDPDQPYELYPQGVRYVKCFISVRKISQGKRNDYILTFVRNLVWLNPNAAYYQLLHVIRYANQRMFYEPLPENELRQKLTWAIRKQKAGELDPKYAPKPKRIAFNPKAGYSGKEKQRIYADILINESKEKIRQALWAWDYSQGEPTYRKLAEITRLGKSTIARYLGNIQAELRVKHAA